MTTCEYTKGGVVCSREAVFVYTVETLPESPSWNLCLGHTMAMLMEAWNVLLDGDTIGFRVRPMGAWLV